MCEELTEEKLEEVQNFRETKLLKYIKLAEALRNDYKEEQRLKRLKLFYNRQLFNFENLLP